VFLELFILAEFEIELNGVVTSSNGVDISVDVPVLLNLVKVLVIDYEEEVDEHATKA
jgi:hypothetical protein